MTKMVKLTIDGQEIEAPEGTLIVDAARMHNIDIPVFCYHPKMDPVGMCRMCLVEIGRPMRDRETGDFVRDEDGSIQIQLGLKLETACTTPIMEGMVVIGTSDKAKAGREDILEFLLTSHPLDCPICDKGGECPLQNLTMGYGPGISRFIYDDKFQFPKHVPLGELIILDRERCIQCARCTRFQDEIVGEPVISFFQRGRALEIVTFSDPGFDSYFSGNTTDICPVGALTTVDFRFEARPWELKSSASICPHCPVGCNTSLDTRREARAGGQMVIKRVMPRQNESVNEIWICDKGRFAHHFAHSQDRINQPMLRRDGELFPVSWEEAIEAAVQGFRQADNSFLAIGSGRLANEDAFNLKLLADGLGGQSALYATMSGGDQVNQYGVEVGTNFSDMGPETAILVVGSDLQEEAPVWWLRIKQAADRGAKLVVANPRWTKLDEHASQVIRYSYGSEAAAVMALIPGSERRTDTQSNEGQTSSTEEIEAASRTLAEAENLVVVFGSEGTGLAQSEALANACSELLAATNHTGRPNNGLIAAWQDGNSQGAWDMGLRPREDLAETLASAQAAYIVAADSAGDSPSYAEAVRSAGFVVVQELYLTETARLADVVLPAQSFIERDGSYTSGERRVQRFYPAVPFRRDCRPDFSITAQIGQRLRVDLEGRSAQLVMERIASQVPGYQGVTYRKLAHVHDQWPIVHREDLYYGGTSYHNRQGLGVKLAPHPAPAQGIPISRKEPVDFHPTKDGLVAVPVTRLYDYAQTVTPSELLRVRTARPYVAMNPTDADRLNVREGVFVTLTGNDDHPIPFRSVVEGVSACLVVLDETVPPGVVLAPRSMGIGIFEPAVVRLHVVKEEAGSMAKPV
jgi:NADH-quinone oxidoreductase subunit G